MALVKWEREALYRTYISPDYISSCNSQDTPPPHSSFQFRFLRRQPHWDVTNNIRLPHCAAVTVWLLHRQASQATYAHTKCSLPQDFSRFITYSKRKPHIVLKKIPKGRGVNFREGREKFSPHHLTVKISVHTRRQTQQWQAACSSKECMFKQGVSVWRDDVIISGDISWQDDHAVRVCGSRLGRN